MREELEKFAIQNKFKSTGPLSVALVITDQAKARSFPLDPDDFLAESGTQVSGLGYISVQSILNRRGITRVLSKEAGRTSRGSVGKMISYVHFLNDMDAKGLLDIKIAEDFWIDKVNAFFAGKPFTLKLDPQLGLRAIVRNLIAQAEQRQKENSGTMYAGTVLQHLVGAKLDIVMQPNSPLTHHNANQNDAKDGRTGDFDIGDVSIHVTLAPSEALINKCAENLSIGRKPIVVTGRKGVTVAEGLAENANLSQRIDVIEFEQFLATNIYELGRFTQAERSLKIEEIVNRYNDIINEVESDPSLLIELASGK